jgi:hypothetical protein
LPASAARSSPCAVSNKAPAAGALAYSTRQGELLAVSAGDGLFSNASDPDGDTLSLVSNTQPAHGSLQVWQNGSFEYTPNQTYTGSDGFTYTLTDGSASTTGTVSITIGAFQA